MTKKNPEPFRNKKIRLSIFYLASFFDGLCILLFPASSMLFKMSPYGMTDAQYGVVFLPMIFSIVTVTLAFKKIHRCLGEEKIFFTALASHALFLGLLGLAWKLGGGAETTFRFVLASNFFLGIGFGLLIAVLNLLCVELFPKQRDSVVSGLHALLGLGAALSPLAVDSFSKSGRWLYVPALYASLLAGVTLLSWCGRAARETGASLGEDSSAPHKGAGGIPRRAALFLVTLFFYGVVEGTLGNWSGIYLTQERGFSQTTAALSLSVFWFFMTAGRLFASFMSLRVDARFLYRVSPFLIILSLAGILWNREESHVLPLYVLAGAGCSYFFPLSISLSTRYFDSWRELLSSLTVAGLMLGVGFGNSVTGFLRSRGFFNLEQIFFGLVMSAAVVAFFAVLLTLPKMPDDQLGKERGL